MKYIPLTALVIILSIYSFLFMATKRVVPCDTDCAAIINLENNLRTGRESYILDVSRCLTFRVNDTLCVYVRDTSGIDWERLADTVCMLATSYSLNRQKLFIIKPGMDTVVRRVCP